MNNIESIEINLSIKKPVNKNSNRSENIASSSQSQQVENLEAGKVNQENLIDDTEANQKINTEGIDDLMHKVQKYVNTFNTKLSFSFDKEANRPVIYVIDKETDELIRQIPPKKMFKLINNLEEIRGIIFQGQA